jgi:Icc protein
VLAQLSDPHMRVGPDDAGSARALEAAVRAVLDLRPAPDAVVVTGDVADGGVPREYERARELLAPLPMPMHVLPGNHDDGDELRACFGDGTSATCGALRLVLVDTTVAGRDDGRLDGERLDRLRAELEAAPQAPTIVAMHHPPLLTGIPALDDIGLPAADRTALAEVISNASQVTRVVAGHVHRTAFGLVGGCGVFACASTNLQARLEIGATEFEIVHEPPAFALHVELDGELVTHVQPVG